MIQACIELSNAGPNTVQPAQHLKCPLRFAQMHHGSAPLHGLGSLSSQQGSTGSAQLPPAGALRSQSAVSHREVRRQRPAVGRTR